MEVRSNAESKQKISDFTKRYINLLKDKKRLDADIKALKDEFKDEGVPVQIVCKAVNVLKTLKKKTDSQIFEEEKIQEWLQEDKDIDNDIGELVAKD